MSEATLRVGQGRISGYISVVLGVISVLAVLAFRYPTWLTTAELRENYDVETLRLVLMGCMVCSVVFGVLTFALNRRKRLGALGVLLTALAYLLGGWGVEAGVVAETRMSIGVDWLVLDLLASAILFIFIEKVIPRYPEQAVLRPEWQLDLFYFALNHVLIAFLIVIANGFAPKAFFWAVSETLQAQVAGLPLLVQVLLLALCADFVLYWVHRAYHEIPILWPFHAVHHCAEHMDWLAGSRTHLLQTIVDRTLAMVPLYLLGASPEALNLYVVLAALQAVFTHANVGIPLGPLKWVLVTPQYHHWHHSSDRPAIDTNYAVHFPLFDRLFGTYHMPDQHWPIVYGTTKRLPRTFLGQLFHPFRKPAPAVEEASDPETP
ncbi:MAG: sterol desaturase family protein [Planctomycetes bacterium]|nr:sterol desaturase family protein [Planctomycetota bacterium]